ncbi:MAG: cytochrome c-type biogenesis protein CcmH [Methylococcales bacterium]|nr:cytochrome c-type biogenesis protein CcmH [Methylococcales bacterium]
MKKLVLCLLLLSQSVHAEIEVYQFTTSELELRYQTLTEELRCLVCQNQNIADSHAELAQDLRRKVYEMLNRGESNSQIIDYMTERYGDFVLYRPPFNARTLILWLAPVLTLLLGGLGFWSLLKRRKTNVDEQLSASERARIAELLHTTSDSK